MLDFLIHQIGNLHPPMVHFPVIASILALFAFACGTYFKRDWLRLTAAWLWVITFLTVFPSLFTGHLFALHLGLVTHFTPIPSAAPMRGLLRQHVLLAMAGTLLSFLTLANALQIFRGKFWPTGTHILFGLATSLAFGVAGHIGGKMVYGEGAPVSAEGAGNAGAYRDIFERVKNFKTDLVQMNSKMWFSKAHGKRWVNTYVSKEAVEAYKNSDPLPEGTMIFKDSFEDAGGKPSNVPGPVWVKVKERITDSPASGGWLFGLKWDQPVPNNPESISGPVTWLPGDAHLSYCLECHSHFKAVDYVGGIPEGYDK